jgi:cytoskeletal protein RodZ
MVDVELRGLGEAAGDVRASEVVATTITVGQKLSQARKNSRVTDIEQISEELCIRPHLLRALEQDDFNKFPSACYAAGFLKNYAAYLGLNVAQVIAQYKNEFLGSNKKVDLVFLKVDKNNNSIQKMVVSLIILSMLVLYGTWYSLRGGDSISLSALPDVTDVTSNILVSTIEDDQKKPEKKVVLADSKDQKYSLVQQANAGLVSGQSKKPAISAAQVRLTVQQDAWVRIVGAVSVYVGGKAVQPFGEFGEIRENISLNPQDLRMKMAQLSH